MARVLHLTDVHLGEPAEWQVIDDHKSTMVVGDRRVEKHVLHETLDSVIGDGTLAGCDAVVISGDLTHRAKPDGFQEFGELTDRLVDAGIAPERIAVVPGNHDVPWDPGPDADGRYEEYLAVTRDKRLVTPLLDRIDFEEDGTLRDEARAHAHVISGEDFVVMTFNSSHFCWGMEDLPDDAAEDLLRLSGDDLVAAVERLRRHDVARISNAQIKALQAYLRETDNRLLGSRDDERVRVSVLHHQLLPVSTREEFKSFESLSNLGAVRQLLAELRTDVVLHGHKHESALYWDYVADPSDLEGQPHRMLVCAGPGSFRPELPVMRILEITPRPAARDVDIVTVRAARRPLGEVVRSGVRGRLWPQGTEKPCDAMSVRGSTVSETYQRIQSLFDTRQRPIYDLVCEILDPSDAGSPPEGYPHDESMGDVEEWMRDLIDWWQLPEPSLLRGDVYNHGERLHGRWGDQIVRAAEVLVEEPQDRESTTRAIMLLIDPEHEASRSRVSFPSFVLVQLHLLRDGAQRRLDCTGFFRKQEMRYWWPINVAELVRIQCDVRRILQERLDSPVRKGRVRTITGQALVEDRLPAVALAAVDRALDQRAHDIWRMAFAVAGDQEDKQEVRRVWERYLKELQPTGEASQLPPASRYGLQRVLTYLTWLKSDDGEVGKALRLLVELYEVAPDPRSARDPFVEQVTQRLADLRSALDQELGAPGAP